MLLPMVTCFQSERSSIADITLSYPHTYNILFTACDFQYGTIQLHFIRVSFVYTWQLCFVSSTFLHCSAIRPNILALHPFSQSGRSLIHSLMSSAAFWSLHLQHFPLNDAALSISYSLVYPPKAELAINSTIMYRGEKNATENKEKREAGTQDSMSKAQMWMPVAGQAAIHSLHSPQIPLLHTAEPHPTPTAPEGSLCHSTPILTNLCGFNNAHNGV